jgi:hypothetical protein
VGIFVCVTEHVRSCTSGTAQSDGWTPLCMASEEGVVEMLKALIVAGAAVNQATVCGVMMDTPQLSFVIVLTGALFLACRCAE